MNLPIFLIGLAFNLIETAYFGWNMFPKSDAELFADGLSYLIVALSFLKIRD